MDTYSPEEKFILRKLEKDLPRDLTYHGLHHTLDVFNAAIKIAQEQHISEHDMKLLRIATLYHDAGFTSVYRHHEEAGCLMARKDLKEEGYSHEDIDTICGMIMATKIPQNPGNILEQIICDADLDYLGRNDFHKISNTLFREMKVYVNLHDEKEWYKIQKKFLENHKYYTSFARINREPLKQQHLQKICDIVESYH